MVVREKFEGELQELKVNVIKMSDMAVASLEKAYKALLDKDIDLALTVLDEDKKLDKLEEDVEEAAILMIAKQQPVASDLRHIISAIKISSEIERVGDYAKNIAKTAIRLAKEERPFENAAVAEMHEIGLRMMAMFKEAYVEENLTMAKELAELDDRMDELYGQVIKSILNASPKGNDSRNQNSQLLFLVRHYERAGDHITNLAEDILYMAKGRRYHLND